MDRRQRENIALSLLFAVVLVGSGVAGYGIYQEVRGHSTSPVAPFIPAQNIVVDSGYTGADCVDVETCSISLTALANSVILFGTTVYADVTLTTAAHGLTTTALESGTTSSTYPKSVVWGIKVTTAATVKVYANYTSDEYYDLEGADFGNTVTLATYDSGTGTSDGDSESGTCSATTTVSGEMVFAIIGDKHTSGTTTYTLGSGQNELDSEATTTDIDTGEDWYHTDASTGAYAMTATLSATEDWESACVGLLPASVPTAPTSLTAGSITSTTVPLTWTDTASQTGTLTGGTVWYAPFSGSCGTYSNASVSVASPYDAGTVTGLTSGDGYCFEVAVSNSTGVSSFSAALTDTYTLAPPQAPTSLVVNPESGTTTELFATWVLAYGTLVNQSFAQYSGSSCSGTGTYTNIADPAQETEVVTGLTAATTYSFKVADENSTGLGAWSSCVSGTTYAVPAAPTGLSDTGSTSQQVNLTWTNPSVTGGIFNVTVFAATYSDGSCGAYTGYTTDGDTSVYDVTGLAGYTTYCFEAAVWSGGAMGTISSVLEVETPAGVPGQPTSFQATGETGTTITTTWTNPSPESGSLTNATFFYGSSAGTDVQGADGNPGTWAHSVNLESALSTYTLTGLSTGTEYYLSVALWTQGGQGEQATAIEIETEGSAPSAPTGLTYVSAGDTSVTTDWTQSAGTITNDTVAYGTISGCTGSLTFVSTDGPASSATVSDLSTATTYYWEVAASSSGGFGAWSSCVTGATKGATPPAPYEVTAPTVGVTYAYVTWQNPSGYSLIDAFVNVTSAGVECGTWHSTYNLGVVEANYEVTGLTAGDTYCIEVTVVDQGSPESGPYYFTTLSSGTSGSNNSTVSPPPYKCQAGCPPPSQGNGSVPVQWSWWDLPSALFLGGIATGLIGAVLIGFAWPRLGVLLLLLGFGTAAASLLLFGLPPYLSFLTNPA